MGNDPGIKVIKRQTCPECGDEIIEKSREKISRNIDWYEITCKNCNWSNVV